jgi:tetratricopeptide (TPR) repeat protein
MQVLAHNYITGNTTGVNCVDYSDADFEINNWVKYNSTGIAIDVTSTPWLGTTQFPVYCSIWGNDWDVWSNYPGTISAQVNYWGSYPANPMIYGTVDYSNELSWEPSMKSPAFLVTKHPTVSEPAKESSLIDTAGIGELDAARKLESRSQSLDAQSAFRSIVTRYAGKLSSEIALVRLETSLDKQSSDPEDMLRSYAETYKGTTLGDLANLRLAHCLIRNGHKEEALDLCLPIANAAGKFEREALYDAGSLLWYRLKNTTEAEKYYRLLIEKYPKDPLAISALATLGESPINDQAAKQSTPESTPTAFSVAEPYPNPFNPSTRIDFTLPEASNVTLVVYDVLGRQVATLAHDLFAAGNHTAKWDGSSVASGVYYARLTVINEIGGVLFSKVTKLLLTK